MTPDVAEKLLTVFRGREEFIAYQPPAGSFKPLKVSGDSIPIAKFCERHTESSSCGFYLLTAASTVHVACCDFDDHSGSNPDAIPEAQMFAKFLITQGFPVYLEQSWSGTGAHVWVFFSSPIKASEARMFMVGALNDCELEGIETYPRQSVLTTEKPLGNLIRYPLAGKSCFLDVETLEPVTDVVGFLRDVQKVTPEQVTSKCWWNTVEVQDRLESSEYEVNGLPSRVLSLMESPEGDLLSKRWLGDVTAMAGDRTNSGLCLSMASEMVRHHIPTPEIEAALRYWCVLNAYGKGLRAKWIESTVRAAYSNVTGYTAEDLSSGSDRIGVILHSTIENILAGSEASFIPTGMAAVDASLGGGLVLGEYIIVGGRPSQGKTATGLHILDAAAKAGYSGTLISLEMSQAEIMSRQLSRLSPVPKDKWRDPEVAKQLHELVDRDIKEKAPVFFTRGGDQSVKAVVKAIREYAERGSKVFVLDYVQILTGGGSDYERVSEASRQLAKLSKELHVAIIVMAQLKRPDDRVRTLQMPRMSDLKNTGQLEQDADIVMAVVWPHQEFPDSYPADQFNVVVLKNRNRGIKVQNVPVRFNKERQLLF
jgi:hypothetical protein